MKIENPFKQKLYSHTVPVRDEVWERIAANLPAQRKGIPFFWTALGGGFLLIGAFIIGLSLLKDDLKTNDTITKDNNQKFTNNANTTTRNENAIGTVSTELTATEAQVNKISTSNTTLKKQNKSTTHINPNLTGVDDIISVSDGPPGEVKDADQINSGSNNELVALSTFTIDPLKQEDDFSDMSHIKPNPNCYRFSGVNGKAALSVDIFAGPGFSPRKFEDTSGESSLYAIGREATEKSQYAWAAGARINLNLQQGLAVRLGLMYEQIGDKFNYTDTGATQISLVIDSFFAADGTFLYTETNTVTILGTLIKKIHNRYTHVDIPLLLSYELPMGRAMIMVNAGPVLNLTSSRRGQILDPTLVPKHITPGERDELKAYKNNLGLSVYLGVGALFPLTDNISALIEPRYLYRIKPVTLDTYPLKEHRHFAGLNLGIRYYFN